jgi:hypothetical protein
VAPGARIVSPDSSKLWHFNPQATCFYTCNLESSSDLELCIDFDSSHLDFLPNLVSSTLFPELVTSVRNSPNRKASGSSGIRLEKVSGSQRPALSAKATHGRQHWQDVGRTSDLAKLRQTRPSRTKRLSHDNPSVRPPSAPPEETI